jgi:hypothetical protein
VSQAGRTADNSSALRALIGRRRRRRVSRSEGASAFGYTAAQIIDAGRARGSPLLMIR